MEIIGWLQHGNHCQNLISRVKRMTIDAAIKEIKENMLCDYCISGCDKCDISSCSNKDAFNMAIQALERNRKK